VPQSARRPLSRLPRFRIVLGAERLRRTRPMRSVPRQPWARRSPKLSERKSTYSPELVVVALSYGNSHLQRRLATLASSLHPRHGSLVRQQPPLLVSDAPARGGSTPSPTKAAGVTVMNIYLHLPARIPIPPPPPPVTTCAGALAIPTASGPRRADRTAMSCVSVQSSNSRGADSRLSHARPSSTRRPPSLGWEKNCEGW
jgi:hypothetical protein